MQSNAENDDNVIALAKEALRLSQADRQRFLSLKCRDRDDLYSQVAEVVEWEERMGDFLSRPLIELIDLDEAEAAKRPFQPPQEISDRFFVVREIGEGGMGVVYEAMDRKLGERIAIKCAKPGFGSLLCPELKGALKVRHPNICLVNDTHTSKALSGEVEFLTMEFIDGETLSARLARENKLDGEEALKIARQLCAGLAAAHEAGILHRDLKTSNIILTRKEDGTLRAVITDFGLASEARLENGLEGGTPRYMAPELWRDAKPSKASDVYALGVILYELVTGSPPFNAGDSWELKGPRPPKAPTLLNKDLDACWDRAILPCLETDPRMRPEVADVLKAFEKRPVWKSPILAVALMLVLLAAAFQRPIIGLFTPAQIRLAIFPAEGADGPEQFGNELSLQVAEQIRRAQSGKGSVFVLPPSTLAAKGVHSPEQAQKLVHATHAVTLKLTSHGDQMNLDADILELRHGTHLREFNAGYSSVTRPDMPAALAAAITGALHLPNPAASGKLSSLARADYEKGLSLLNGDDQSYEPAMQSFTAAAEKDPHSGLPLAGLVEAELLKSSVTTDRNRKWLDAANRHLHQAEALSPDAVPVLLARGDLQLRAGQTEQGLESYRRAEELDPTNTAVLLPMAEAYERENLPDAALRFYRRAIAATPDNYQPYQALGLFYYSRGDYAASAEKFQKGVDLAPDRYDLHIYLGSARGEKGEYGAAEQEFAASLKIRKTGWALCGLGAIKESEGRDEAAVRLLQQSVALDSGSTTCYLNLGDSLRRLHRGPAARAAYVRAFDLSSSEIRNNPRGGFERAFIGYLSARLGQRTRAIDETLEALQMYPQDSKVLRRAVLTYEALGERVRALEVAAKAPLSVLQELDRHPDLDAFRRDPRFRELLEEAEKRGN